MQKGSVYKFTQTVTSMDIVVIIHYCIELTKLPNNIDVYR